MDTSGVWGRVKFNVFVTHLNRHHDPGVQRCVGWRENRESLMHIDDI